MRPVQTVSLALAALILLAFSVFLVVRYLPDDAPAPRTVRESAPPSPLPAEPVVRAAEPASAPAASVPTSPPAAPAALPLASAPPLGIPKPTDQDIFQPRRLLAPGEGGAPDTAGGLPLALGPEQQEELRRVLESHMIMQSDAEFPLVVGATVPEGVYLTRLPDEVADLIPDHRSYSYLFVQNRIVIVATQRRQVSLLFPL